MKSAVDGETAASLLSAEHLTPGLRPCCSILDEFTKLRQHPDMDYRNQLQTACNAIPDRPMPNSPIFTAIAGILKRTEELTETIKSMGNKLAPILRPEPVMMAGQMAKACTEPPQVESDLTQQLRQHAETLETLITHVNQLRERVEV